MNDIQVLLTTNEAFAQHAAVCIKSLQVNNPNLTINIVIASLELTPETQKKLLTLSIPKKCHIKLVEFDRNKLEPLPLIGKYSKDIYLRLWVDEYFKDIACDKVLYLDADTIVVNPLDDIINLDMGNNLIAAVDIPDSTSHNRCHLPKDKGYFNSGVLLFNVNLWRDEACLDQIISFLNENKEIALNPDQDALNGLFFDRRITLNHTFNAISPFFRKKGFPSIGNRELAEIRQNVTIVHFNGRSRPWLYGCNHPYERKYNQYLLQTPWKDKTNEGFTVLKFIKKQLRVLLGTETFVTLKKLNGN